MRILSLIGKGILDVLWILVRIAGAVLWLALGALRGFLMLLSLVPSESSLLFLAEHLYKEGESDHEY